MHALRTHNSSALAAQSSASESTQTRTSPRS
eukprot:CAMPEP_0185854852 /NCGR_PEP_ID=MMETSP1354-20130828/23688_1 /TAXON_ID=708628 /ORGANISM="Erythrolobus madagascarensis, Strain CCMP3276" /LENGTH=30 /DNA_ID= /DNA_START= /DNA_END= /DNA_ORIENTATION=